MHSHLHITLLCFVYQIHAFHTHSPNSCSKRRRQWISLWYVRSVAGSFLLGSLFALPVCSFPCVHSHVFIPMCSFPCVHSHVFIPMCSFPCVHSRVFIPVCSFPCVHSHVFIPMCLFPCVHSRVFIPMCSFPCVHSHVLPAGPFLQSLSLPSPPLDIRHPPPPPLLRGPDHLYPLHHLLLALHVRMV